MTSSPLHLAAELDGLHQLLYTRGGIRPSNAAVEELTKLLFLRVVAARDPEFELDGLGRFSELVTADRLAQEDGVGVAKRAFSQANMLPEFMATLPDGNRQSIWPEDEPLRISRSDVLSEAFRVLSTFSIGAQGHYDPLGAAFDVFLRGRFENAGGLGTYLTPETVVDMMVEVGLSLLGDEGSGGLVGDPCCGSGRFLVGLLHGMREKGFADVASRIFGADQSASSVAMAQVNLLAAGVASPEVFVVEDSITDEHVSSTNGTFRLILTNPPFGDKKYDSAKGISYSAGTFPLVAGAPKIDPALAFVARCIDLLDVGGVAGIILPDGVADGPSMRKLLLEDQLQLEGSIKLEGVVSLPSATFAPAGTTAKTSVVFIRKLDAPLENRVAFFGRALHVGYVMGRGKSVPDPQGDDLPPLAAGIRKILGGSSSPGFDDLVVRPLKDLRSLDASAVDKEAENARVKLSRGGGETARSVMTFSGKRRTKTALNSPFVSVLHVDQLGVVDWSAAQLHRPTTPGQLAEPGDILVSLLNPSKFRAAVIPSAAGEVQCSAEFGVFQTDSDPYAVLALLQHPLVREQLAPMGRGTSSSRRRVSPDDVLDLVLPPHSTEWLAQAGAKAKLDFEEISRAQKSLRHLYSDLLEISL